MDERTGMDGLVAQAQKGDRGAMDRLVCEHYARVYRFCARRVGEAAGQDAAQETFVTMVKSIGKYAGRSSFPTWLLGVANRTCMALARKRRLEPMPLEAWHDGGTDTESAAIDRVALAQALRSLSPEHREVVVMHEVEGLRYAEIAEILDVPEGTVKSRLHHAFLNMRKQLVGGRQ